MNVKDARQKLEEIVANSTLGGPVMAAADALGDARELRGHVGACLKKKAATDARGLRSCGVGDDPWYCAEAKEVTA